MKYDPAKHHRKSIRLKEYDYSKNGLYFITICVQHRACLFGKVENSEMVLNDGGLMIDREWRNIMTRFPNTELHEYVVMPNHFHGILEITTPPVGATLVVAQDPDPNDNSNPTLVVAQDPDPNDNSNPTLVVAQDPDPNDNSNPTLVVAQDPGPNDNSDPNNPIKQMDDGIKIIQSAQNDTPEYGQLYKGQPQGIAPTVTAKTVGDMVGAFKSITTDEYILGVKNSGWLRFDGKLWQRNYYEHIIRNHESYLRIVNYIANNPAKWKDDKFYAP